MNFKEFFESTTKVFKKEQRKTGVYISAKFDDKSEKQIYNWISSQNIGDATISPIKDYHCTVIYSRKDIPKDEWINEIVLYRAKPKALRIFPYDKGSHCLVLELKSPSLEKLHKDIIKLGATHDYPDYIPHVTIAYGIDSDFKIDNLQLPEFELIITEIKSEKLDLDWASK